MELIRRVSNIWGDLPALEVRADAGDPAKKTLVGYAAVLNKWADIGYFKERLLPGSLDRTKKKDADIRALNGHQPELVVGRTKSGTLSTKVDKKGLLTEADVSTRSSIGMDLLDAVERGDVDGMSIGFRVISDRWGTENEELVRDLLDINVVEVSYTAFPAYTDTSVSARAEVRAICGIGIVEGERFITALLKHEHRVELTDDDIKLLKDGAEKLSRVSAQIQEAGKIDPPNRERDQGQIKDTDWYRRRLRLAEISLTL